MRRAEPAGSSLFAQISETPAVQHALHGVEQGGVSSLSGVSAGAMPFLGALLNQVGMGRQVMVVCPNPREQERVHQEIETWLELEQPAKHPCKPGGKEKSTVLLPLYFPAWDVLPHESKLPHADVISERLETLMALSQGTSETVTPASPIIVTESVALLQYTFHPDTLRRQIKRLKLGDRIDPLDLVEWLENLGYEPEAQVSQKGEIALRGGILDVFPMASPWPVRLEYFGDEIESIRFFDPHTQISRERIESVTLSPGGELGLLKNRQVGVSDCHGTLPDFLPKGALVLFLEPEEMEDRATDYLQQVPEGDPLHTDWESVLDQLQDGGLPILEIRAELEGTSEPVEKANRKEPPLDSLPLFQTLEAYRPLGEMASDPQIADAQRREFFNQIHRWLRHGFRVEVMCGSEGELQRFRELWSDYGLDTPTLKRKGRTDGALACRVGSLSRGFLAEEALLVVVTDAEIFGRYRAQRPRRLKSPHAAAMKSALEIDFSEMSEGDHVVHLQHGIGRYLGLQVLPVGKKNRDGIEPKGGQECMVIEYAGRDPEQPPPMLYVPVTEAHLVSKYVGSGSARPPLNTLGSRRWSKTREQAEKAVADLAADLLALQATRDAKQGHAFGGDTPWQREFEGTFPFEETPDQWVAIQATKTDMEQPKPMDRLVCGDVGFGKTEVALRAAFKAVLDGRQVAVLVPTTVLAQQHYNTFRERMAEFPVRVDLLSRFRKKRQADETIAGLTSGAVDIVIGTHKLIQASVQFRDLGLLIIDEEQRFGVLHKEKLKMMRQMVDVLTLTATPIPRTLHLALTGARDMSTIETPPQDRLPIETLVSEWDDRVIRDAIQRELNRGGQVFFLHNRVMTIDTIADRLRRLVPKARLVVGHGQMNSATLEGVMTTFVSGKANILLSTTIIESGLDIPNANTMIIDRADRFGLSELYQLRGRVGRYKHQAYAYLIIPRHAALLADARKRISALKQYSKLGSGFKIAMRDLEIRGAGNILGAQQSGHIAAVGFELYCQLLKQSISRLKGEKVKRRIEVTVKLDFLATNPGEETRPEKKPKPRRAKLLGISVPRSEGTVVSGSGDDFLEVEEDNEGIGQTGAYLPFGYIPETQPRIMVYRRLAQLSNLEEWKVLKEELRDRFGQAPKPVELLLRVAELKVLAAGKTVTAIESRGDRIMVTLNNDLLTLGGKFPRFTKKTAAGRLGELKSLLKSL